MIHCLILADDLSGAADSAVAALHVGLEAEVFFTVEGAQEARAAIVAIDLNTREIAAEQARAVTLKSLERIRPRADLFLYRKVDSTLRGNVAAELAATLTATGKQFILFAPAFPANRRTTVDGRILVGGKPLEQTQFWSAKSPDFATQMANAGLLMESLPLETVRRGKEEIHRTVSDLVAEGAVTILCDAESDEDLFQLAQAGFEFGTQCLFAGSGGLAKQLFKLFPPGDLKIPVPRNLGKSTLIAVGSFTKNSQAQLGKLDGVVGLRRFLVGPEELSPRSMLRLELERALEAGQDLAVGINAGVEFSDAIKPSDLLARLLLPALDRVGALIVTGGETCRALLESIGVTKLQLLDELGPGVALGFASVPRPMLVVVKAGGFGDEGTLLKAYNFLKKIRISHE